MRACPPSSLAYFGDMPEGKISWSGCAVNDVPSSAVKAINAALSSPTDRPEDRMSTCRRQMAVFFGARSGREIPHLCPSVTTSLREISNHLLPRPY
jgi:hypothetical protein